MFLRRSLAHVRYMLGEFYFSVGIFGGLAPQFQKAGYATGDTPFGYGFCFFVFCSLVKEVGHVRDYPYPMSG